MLEREYPEKGSTSCLVTWKMCTEYAACFSRLFVADSNVFGFVCYWITQIRCSRNVAQQPFFDPSTSVHVLYPC